MQRWLAVVLAYGGAAVRPAIERAAPLYLVGAVVALLLFTGDGIRPADLIQAARADARVHLGLVVAWVVLPVAVFRPLLGATDTLWLRTMPVSRGAWLGLVAVCFAAFEAPWLALWAAGAGPLAGLAALVCAGAAHAWLAAPPRSWLEVGAALAAVLVFLAPPLVALGAGVPLFVIGVWTGWARAPERRARPGSSAVPRRWYLALAWARLAALRRRDKPALVRALGIALGLAALCGLVAANNRLAELATVAALSAGFLAASAVAATGALAAAALRAELADAGYFEALGATARARQLGTSLVIGWLGAWVGFFHAMTVGIFLAVTPLGFARLAAGGAALGAGLGLMTVYLHRRSLARPDQPERLVVALVVLVVIVMVLAGFFGDAAALAILLLGFVAALAPPPPHAGAEAILVSRRPGKEQP